MTTTNPIPSREDVEKLKSDWIGDPCWDLEMTEGFEAFYDELLTFRMDREASWKAQADKALEEQFRRRLEVARDLGLDNIDAVAVRLLAINDRLANEISELRDRVANLEHSARVKP